MKLKFPKMEIEKLFYQYTKRKMPKDRYTRDATKEEQEIYDTIMDMTFEIGDKALTKYRKEAKKLKKEKKKIKKTEIKVMIEDEIKTFIRRFRPKNEIQKDFVLMLKNNFKINNYIKNVYEMALDLI